ncbi:MAG: hypothetical protein ACQEV0_00735 [Bacillota bacterium]
MRYVKSNMEKLVNQEPELKKRLKVLMKEMELEKGFALKALYHSEVADSGPFMKQYQELADK